LLRDVAIGGNLEGFTYTDEQQRAILDALRPLQSGAKETEIIALLTLAARHAKAQALLVEDRPSAQQVIQQLEQLSSSIGALDLHCRSYLDAYLRAEQLGALHRIESVVVRLALILQRRLRREPVDPDEFSPLGALPTPPPVDWSEIDGFHARGKSRNEAAVHFVQRAAEIYRQATGRGPTRRSHRSPDAEGSFYGFVLATIGPPKLAHLSAHGVDSLIRRALNELRPMPLRDLSRVG
jgi:hypothetical protein